MRAEILKNIINTGTLKKSAKQKHKEIKSQKDILIKK